MRLGTRGSELALAQSRLVAQALAVQVETVTTAELGDGDNGLPTDKRRWVATLEAALLEGRIDLAVHSAKDLPGELAPGLELGAVLARGPAEDVVVCRDPGLASLADLPQGARLGTASLRRAAQLKALRPDLVAVPTEGNVDTRLRKLEHQQPPLEGLVLARAGLERLGYRRLGFALSIEQAVPAPGQGVIAVEVRAGDRLALDAVEPLCDRATLGCLEAERAAARALGADCNSAIGLHARVVGGELELLAFVGAADGSAWLRDRWVGALERPRELGEELARRLLRAGGEQLLAGGTVDG